MLRLRRLTALVLNLLLIQVSLAGDGRTCVERGNPVGEATSTTAVAHVSHVSDEAERPCRDAATDQTCPRPWTPDECAAQTACAAPALLAGVTPATGETPPGDPLWADAALMRQGPRPAPDLPPPRA